MDTEEVERLLLAMNMFLIVKQIFTHRRQHRVTGCTDAVHYVAFAVESLYFQTIKHATPYGRHEVKRLL
jgi:hypothetical protein